MRAHILAEPVWIHRTGPSYSLCVARYRKFFREYGPPDKIFIDTKTPYANIKFHSNLMLCLWYFFLWRRINHYAANLISLICFGLRYVYQCTSFKRAAWVFVFLYSQPIYFLPRVLSELLFIMLHYIVRLCVPCCLACLVLPLLQ